MTRRPLYRQVAEEIFEYILRDMTDREGGFYSAEDADSEGEEGKFYVWTKDEVMKSLGEEEGRLFCEYFDVTTGGNFEHDKSILNVPRSMEAFSEERGLDLAEVSRMISSGKKKLFYVREKRVRPARDEQILTSWNALMLTSLAEAANILGRDDYREVAIRNADFLLKNLMQDGRLLRTYKDGRAKLNAYLDDYAYLVEALLAVYEATFETKYFEEARRLADTMIAQFWDDSEAGFFFTSADHEQLITRTKEYFDNATPSGNSVAALVLQKLGLLTQESEYQRCAVGILHAIHQAMARYPSAFGYMLCALDFYLAEPKEIAIVGVHGSHEVRSFVEEIFSRYLPNKVLALGEPDDLEAGFTIKLLAGRPAIEGKATAYVCRLYTCLAPATTTQDLAQRLEE